MTPNFLCFLCPSGKTRAVCLPSPVMVASSGDPSEFLTQLQLWLGWNSCQPRINKPWFIDCRGTLQIVIIWNFDGTPQVFTTSPRGYLIHPGLTNNLELSIFGMLPLFWWMAWKIPTRNPQSLRIQEEITQAPRRHELKKVPSLFNERTAMAWWTKIMVDQYCILFESWKNGVCVCIYIYINLYIPNMKIF